VELTRRLAHIHFEVEDPLGPLSQVAIHVNDFTVFTDASGLAWISGQPARREYTYFINNNGYNPVRDTFFLETDTTITIQMEPETGFINHSLEFLKIYPNPATDMIRFSSAVDLNIQITGLDGKVLMREEVQSHTGELNVSGLPEGCYIMRIQYRQYSKFTRTIIIR
jgi:hypothetical protein